MGKLPVSSNGINGISTTADWRLRPGFVCEGGSDFESIHVLLGYFLRDHDSPNPLPEPPLFTPEGRFEWGETIPLEKVIRSQDDLDFLQRNPLLFRNSIAIIEPWDHVGFNNLGEGVRASKNIAYILQKIADADSYLLPVWKTGVFDLDNLTSIISSGLAVVVEGGDPSIYKPESFTYPELSRDHMMGLVERLILARSPTSAPVIFICLGHQLACAAHVSLLRRAVQMVLSTERLEREADGRTIRVLQRICQRIQEVGDTLEIHKHNSELVASGWTDERFAVAPNEVKEIGTMHLQAYRPPDIDGTHVPFPVIHAHDIAADEFEGVIDTLLEYARDVRITMFHSDEVNEEAVLFANWAYRLLHDAIAPHRHIVAGSELAWLLKLPYAVEILASTAVYDDVITEVAATCINYKDFETRKVRRSFSIQFHPELLADMRPFGQRSEISYRSLKTDDGVRLLARLLYAAMQE